MFNNLYEKQDQSSPGETTTREIEEDVTLPYAPPAFVQPLPPGLITDEV